MSSEGKQDFNSNSGKDSFTAVKHWIWSKFSSQSEDGDIDSDESRDMDRPRVLDNVIPRILISRGSEKSINSVVASPVPRRPSPLTKTWTNYKKLDVEGKPRPSTAPVDAHQTFSYSPLAVSRMKKAVNYDSNSMPITPIREGKVKHKPNTVLSADAVMMKSPIFRFSQRNKIPLSGLAMDNRSVASRSDLDSLSYCGACGQRKFYGSREFVGFDAEPPAHLFQHRLNVDSNMDEMTAIPNNLNLRRSSSCKSQISENILDGNNQRSVMMKASSSIDMRNKVIQVERSSQLQISAKKKLKSKTSKRKSKSTTALNRSMSQPENCSIIRNDSTKSDRETSKEYRRKMSLNDNELRRVRERRRSSLLRLLCIDHASEGHDDIQSSVDSANPYESIDDWVESPKVTRSLKINTADFRSTFEAESIRIPSEYGQVKVMFQFFNEKRALHVTLLKGANVGCLEKGRLNIHASVCLMPGKFQRQTGQPVRLTV